MSNQNNDIPEGLKMTELGPLPEEWETTKLGDLFDIKQGKALSPEHRRGISPRPFLRTANVFWGYIDLANVDSMDFTDAEVSQLKLIPNDLLVCEGGDIGRTAIWRGDSDICCYQNHLHRLRTTRTDVYPLFYMYWMQAAYLLLGLYGGTGNKTTIPNLSQSRLKSFVLPLPPVPEQRAIAYVLSTIWRAIEAQGKIIAAVRELKKSLMRHLFTYGPVPISEAEHVSLKETEIGPVPEHWEVVRLGKMSGLITKGSSPNWQGFEYCDEGIIFIRSQNIGSGRLELQEVAHLPDAFNRKEKKSIIHKDDLLINIVGASIGRAAVASEFIEGGNLNQAVALARLKVGMEPNFVMNFLLDDDGQEQLHKQKKEIARANLSLQGLNNLIIPCPRTIEQQEIVNTLSTVENKIKSEENIKAALQVLFKTMLHQLMTGKVRVKDLEATAV